ncbi:MAG: PAS-domain containing protein, partial [Alphaproteobacteria bacterium]|nr:PAS-domain containing protein [Alphaproteobacteria bacterium]
MADHLFRPLACNQKFKDLLGFPPSLFLDGLPSFETLIMFNARRGEYGPGDPYQITMGLLDRARRMEPHIYERSRPDGTVLQIRGMPLPEGGFVTVYTDITDRKRAEEEATRANTYLHTVLHNLPQGISVSDENLNMELWNSAFCEILELPPETMRKGMSFAEVFRHNAKRGEYGPGDVEEQVKRRVDLA